MDDVSALAGILQSVSSETAAVLVGHLQQVAFPRRHTVFAEGAIADNLYIILAGQVKIRHGTPHGREALIALLGRGEIFGELALFDEGTRTSTVTTVTEMHAMSLDRDALQHLMLAHPEIAEQLLRLVARRLRRTSNALCDLIFTDVPGRVAKQLLDLAMRFGTSDGESLRVEHELSQKEFAQLVGATRETVNKALSDFTRRGWIRYQRKTFFIDQPAKLARRARA